MRIWQAGSIAPDDHHFRPLITYLSPSRSILVAMLVASDEATSGSVMQNAERISPSSRGRSHCSRCCSVPNSASSSMLPVSGAAQFSASGASAGLCPVISASGAYWRLVSPAPSGWLARKRFHSPRLRASALSSATTGGRCHGNPDLAAAAVCSAKTGSAGKTCSAMKASSRSRHSCVRPSYAKSTAPPDGSGQNFTYPRVSTAVAGFRGGPCPRRAEPGHC